MTGTSALGLTGLFDERKKLPTVDYRRIDRRIRNLLFLEFRYRIAG